MNYKIYTQITEPDGTIRVTAIDYERPITAIYERFDQFLTDRINPLFREQEELNELILEANNPFDYPLAIQIISYQGFNFRIFLQIDILEDFPTVLEQVKNLKAEFEVDLKAWIRESNED